MTEHNTPFDFLELSEKRIVLDTIARFEHAWINAKSQKAGFPSIEAFLEDLRTEIPSQCVELAALFQLVLLEWDYRNEQSDAPTREEYFQRFPNYAYIIAQALETVQPSRNRYEVVSKLAEGGLGVISIAVDRKLNREVAHKELKGKFVNDPSKWSRFRREAEVTGRLQHPGIISVYSFDETTEGKPSYVMPLIDGEQLADAIDRFHSKARDRSLKGSYQFELRILLRSFIDVCQAIAYAHSQGYIHRDIKPQNVMLGKFGETLVVDWGLAKQLSAKEENRFQTVNLHSNSQSDTVSNFADITQTGDVFGTPMFMSPEQASGQSESVGKASDIYSLGATLYNLLTGVLPFESGQPSEVISLVISGEFRKPREVAPNIPPALESICLKCMALKPEDRYESVELLTSDLERWLANESVSTYSEPIGSRIARLARRFPTWVATGTVASALLLIASIVIAAISTANNRQLTEAKLDAENKQKLAESRLVQIENGAKLFGDIFGEVDPINQDEFEGVPLNERLNERIRNSVAELDRTQIDDPLVRASVHLSFGRMYSSLGMSSEALRLTKGAYEIRLNVLGEKHKDTLEAMSALLDHYWGAGEMENAQKLGEECLRLARETQYVIPNGISRTLAVMRQLCRVYVDSNRSNEAIQMLEHEIKQRAQIGMDSEKSLLHVGLGRALMRVGRYKEAIPNYQLAISYIEPELGSEHAMTMGVKTSLAESHEKVGNPKKAIEMLEPLWESSRKVYGANHCITIRKKAILAQAYQHIGQLAKSVEICHECTGQLATLLGEEHKYTIEAMSKEASSLLFAGQYEKALPIAQRANELNEKYWGKNHYHVLTRRRSLIDLLNLKGQSKEALEMALETYDELKAILDENHTDLATASACIGRILISLRRNKEAVPYFEKSLAIRQKHFPPSHTDNVTAVISLSVALDRSGGSEAAIRLLEGIMVQEFLIPAQLLAVKVNLAACYSKTGRLPEAIAITEEAWRMSMETDGEFHPNTIKILSNLSAFHDQHNDYQKHLELAKQAFESFNKIYGKKHPHTIAERSEYAFGLFRRERYSDALPHYQELLEQADQTEPYQEMTLRQRLRVAEIHYHLGDLDTAERLSLEAYELLQKHSTYEWFVMEAKGLLGAVYAKQQKFAEAEPLLTEAYEGLIQFKSQNPRPQFAEDRIKTTNQRIVEMYESWGKAEEVLEWKAKLP